MKVAEPHVKVTVHVGQGEHAIGCDPDMVIGTILGSCVSACLWDPDIHVGGMNHIILPDRTEDGIAIEGHGASAMERLINALLRKGASRSRLRAKIFGGANMIAGLSDIGQRNIEFILDYVERERIPVDGSSLGGNQARMIRFWPHSGRVRQRLADKALEVIRPTPTPVGNDVELF